MINYFDLYKSNAIEIDLIKDQLCGAGVTTNVITYKVPQFYFGFTTAFLIRETDADYTRFTFTISINDVDVFNQWNLNTNFIPLLPQFIYFMRPLVKGDVIKLDIQNTGSDRTVLGWIKLSFSKEWKI